MFIDIHTDLIFALNINFNISFFSSENYKDFELWQQYDDAQDNFCVKESSPGEYVDLLLNPERYTGYKGPSAHRIWRNIYMENCFRYVFAFEI